MQHSASTPHAPAGNLLLSALPEADYRRLQPHLEPVALPFGKIICEPGEPVTHVFFPTAGIVSLLTPLEDNASVEIAVTGNEGLVGISSFLAGAQAPGWLHRAIVQVAGRACRLRADFLRKEFEWGGELRNWLLRYTQALITQIAQTAVCNRHHRLEAQLCRWLLLRLDRGVGRELHVTQEQIANLLGVRREGVTEAAKLLQSAGSIGYSRGHLVVLDRPALEQRVCECHRVVEKEYARLLSHRAPNAGESPQSKGRSQKTGD